MPEHVAHSQMTTDMTRHHYKMLGINLLVSGAIMYLVMFTMIWSAGDFYNNLNMLYMAVMMATPMGILMLLFMRMMYSNKRVNLILYALFVVLFLATFVGMRQQSLVGDRQFIRAMIPHHSGAILMCNRASIQDAEIRQICFNANGIVESQKREILQMKAILKRL